MQIEFQLSPEEYIAFHKQQSKDRFRKKAPITIVIMIIVIINCFTNHYGWLGSAVVILAFVLLIALLSFFLPLWVFKHKLKNLIKTVPAYSERRRWIIEENGLQSEGASEIALRAWDSFKLAVGHEKYICLTLTNKQVMFLPRSVFSSEAEANDFLTQIQSNILKSKGYSNLIIKT